MLRFTLSLTFIALTASLFAVTPRHAAYNGTYNLLVSEETRSFCKLIGVSEPEAAFKLKDDSFSFSCRTQNDTKHAAGRVKLQDGNAVLETDTEDALFARAVGHFQGDRLVVDGLTYVRSIRNTNISGTWYMRHGLDLDRSVTFKFNDDNTFEFKGMGGTSKGNYHVDEEGITLEYKEIDGELVETGTIRPKTLPLDDQGASFRVDKYRYERDS